MDGILHESTEIKEEVLCEALSLELEKTDGVGKVDFGTFLSLVEKYRSHGPGALHMILKAAKLKLDRSGFNQVMYGVVAAVGMEKLFMTAEFFIREIKEPEKGREIYRLAIEKNSSPSPLIRVLESVTSFMPEEYLICDTLSKIIRRIDDDGSDRFYRIAEAALLKLKSRHCQIRFIMDLHSVRSGHRDCYRLSALVYNVLADRKWALELCEMAIREARYCDPPFALHAAKHLYRLTGDGTLSMPPLETYMKIMEDFNEDEEV